MEDAAMHEHMCDQLVGPEYVGFIMVQGEEVVHSLAIVLPAECHLGKINEYVDDDQAEYDRCCPLVAVSKIHRAKVMVIRMNEG